MTKVTVSVPKGAEYHAFVFALDYTAPRRRKEDQPFRTQKLMRLSAGEGATFNAHATRDILVREVVNGIAA